MAGSTPESLTADQAPVAGASAGVHTAGAAGAHAKSPGFETWRRFRRHRLAVIGMVVLAVMTIGVVVGPLLWQIPINEIDFGARLATPSRDHPFRTDYLGPGLLAPLLYAGPLSLSVGAPPL